MDLVSIMNLFKVKICSRTNCNKTSEKLEYFLNRCTKPMKGYFMKTHPKYKINCINMELDSNLEDGCEDYSGMCL